MHSVKSVSKWTEKLSTFFMNNSAKLVPVIYNIKEDYFTLGKRIEPKCVVRKAQGNAK
jgi:hypothetical protein